VDWVVVVTISVNNVSNPPPSILVPYIYRELIWEIGAVIVVNVNAEQ